MEVAKEEELTEEQLYIKFLNNREHMDSPACWCFPELISIDPETNIAVYKHFLPN